jgi:hypothetical protein
LEAPRADQCKWILGLCRVGSLDWELDDYDSSHSASVSPPIRPKDGLVVDSDCNLQHIQDLHFLHSATCKVRNNQWDHERMEWNAHV